MTGVAALPRSKPALVIAVPAGAGYGKACTHCQIGVPGIFRQIPHVKAAGAGPEGQ
jgi:hypothetical protein